MRDPIRLEPWLVRDFVDRQQKMHGLSERQATHEAEMVAYWVVLGVLITWILLNW